jgi:hypothetical protein
VSGAVLIERMPGTTPRPAATLPSDTVLPTAGARGRGGPTVAAELSRRLARLMRVFATTRWHLEARRFDPLAARYAAAGPLRLGMPEFYGTGFPRFLAARPEFAAATAILDLARFDWALHEITVAVTAAPMAGHILARAEPALAAQPGLILAAGWRLFEAATPVHLLWLACRQGRSAAAGPADAVTRLLITREPGGGAAWRVLAAGEFTLLRWLGAGRTIGEALGAAATAEPGCEPAALLERLVAAGTLVAHATRWGGRPGAVP